MDWLALGDLAWYVEIAFYNTLISIRLNPCSFLSSLPLAAAADTASVVNCGNDALLIPAWQQICAEAQTAEAFSFLAWLLCMTYWIALLIFAIMAHSKGNTGIWTDGVRDADWSGRGYASSSKVNLAGGVRYGTPGEQNAPAGHQPYAPVANPNGYALSLNPTPAPYQPQHYAPPQQQPYSPPEQPAPHHQIQGRQQYVPTQYHTPYGIPPPPSAPSTVNTGAFPRV
jgi:hypothetical protein